MRCKDNSAADVRQITPLGYLLRRIRNDNYARQAALRILTGHRQRYNYNYILDALMTRFGVPASNDRKRSKADALAKDLESGKVKNFYVIDRDLAKVWGAERARSLIAKAGFSVFQGPNKGALSDSFRYRLPATAYVEENGHFTNFEGKVQSYKKALDPIGEARPDWEIFGLLYKAMSRVPA